MTGVEIIGALLREDAAVTESVAEASIKGGRLPANVELPALLVRVVSLVERHPLKRTGWERRTARIAVAVRATSYRDQGAIIELVRKCCTGRTGDIGGGFSVSIRPAGLGPDMDGPGDTFEQTQDFRVSFDAPL